MQLEPNEEDDAICPVAYTAVASVGMDEAGSKPFVNMIFNGSGTGDASAEVILIDEGGRLWLWCASLSGENDLYVSPNATLL